MTYLRRFAASAALASSVALGGMLPAQAQPLSFNMTSCWSPYDNGRSGLEHFNCRIALYDTKDGIRVVRWSPRDGKHIDHAFFFSKETRKPMYVEIRLADGTRAKKDFFVDNDGDYRVLKNKGDHSQALLVISPPRNAVVAKMNWVTWDSGAQSTTPNRTPPPFKGEIGGGKSRPSSQPTLRQLFN